MGIKQYFCRSLRISLAVTTIFILAGCGGSSGSATSSSGSMASALVNPMKGQFCPGATVSVSDKNNTVIGTGMVVSSGVASIGGLSSLAPPPYVLKVGAGASASCYYDEVTGTNVVLPANTTAFRAVVSSFIELTDASGVAVTPLTEMAYQSLSNSGTLGVVSEVESTNAAVATGFGLSNILRVPTLIGQGTAPLATGSSHSDKYALAIAALAKTAVVASAIGGTTLDALHAQMPSFIASGVPATTYISAYHAYTQGASSLLAANAVATALAVPTSSLSEFIAGTGEPHRDGLLGGSLQGVVPNLAGNVTTLAGTAGMWNMADGFGAMAGFNKPYGIVSDGANLYVADSSNHTIRKIVIATGQVSTFAGTAGIAGSADGFGTAASFATPFALATDGANLYVADTDNHIIRRIVIATGQVTTLAGTAGTFGSVDGVGSAASFFLPAGIASDGANLYVADIYDHTIRKIVIATGQVSTLAGSTAMPGSADGIGTAARFRNPAGIAADGSNLYVSDMTNNRIRKIVIATGEVTTLAGNYLPGSADGVGGAAGFNKPFGITTDGVNLYVADSANYTMRKIVIASGQVTTLAGWAGSAGSADGTGAAARFNWPSGLASDGANLYVADTDNNTIRKVDAATGLVNTLAGTAGTAGSVDGTGTAARFNSPQGITTDGLNLYVADKANHTIRKVVIATGQATTLAGTAGMFATGNGDGIGAAARFRDPAGITTDGANLYVVETLYNSVRKIVIATGEVTTLAGTAGTIGVGSADGIGAAARFDMPTGITTDGLDLYLTDSANNTIRKIVVDTGQVTTFAGTADARGSTDGVGVAARFNYPKGIASDGANLYVVDSYNYTIRKIVIATGQVTTLAGTAGMLGSADGIGAAARFNSMSGITSDGVNLYVSDGGSNNTIRKIVTATGEVTTLAGMVGWWGSVDGSGSTARFNKPEGITTDGVSLYVADSLNNAIRKLQ